MSIFFITGTSGCGKSTLVALLQLQLLGLPYAVYDFDEVGVPENPDIVWRKETTDYWLSKASEHNQKNESTIICGVTVPSEIVQSCKNFDEDINFIFLQVPDEIIRERLQQRGWNDQSIHDNIVWAKYLQTQVLEQKNHFILDTTLYHGPLDIAVAVIEYIKETRSYIPVSKLDITVEMVKKLIAQQFPQWADLPIKPVAVSGHDNRTFHLGDSMSVRLPSDYEYVAAVKKEHKWLPLLAKHVSIAISHPIALGKPNEEYPFPWSIYQWIEGSSANMLELDEQALQNIAQQLAQFLQQLHCIDPTDGPVTDRGGSVVVYDDEARSSIAQLNNWIDVPKALSVWNCAISSRWQGKPVWAHGDLSAGNILVQDGQLCAVIDFGGMTVGDPACDLVIAWILLYGQSRALFKSFVRLDVDTWHRAAGWALWKACITLVALDDKNCAPALKQLQIIHDILDEY